MGFNSGFKGLISFVSDLPAHTFSVYLFYFILMHRAVTVISYNHHVTHINW